MTLVVQTFVLGPLANNSYLVADPDTGVAAAIDPSFDPAPILRATQAHGWKLEAVWLTHAHFDHIAGVAALLTTAQIPLQVSLHPADLPLYRHAGGADYFGVRMPVPPEPDHLYNHGDSLTLGGEVFTILHTPGHSLGHVAIHHRAEAIVFSGDLIFSGSVGRTDLPGGSYDDLMASIKNQILTLPPETRLLSGHGPETTVDRERRHNPFLTF